MLKRIFFVVFILAAVVAAGLHLSSEKPPSLDAEIAAARKNNNPLRGDNIPYECSEALPDLCPVPSMRVSGLVQGVSCDEKTPKEECLVEHVLSFSTPEAWQMGEFWHYLEFCELAVHFASKKQLQGMLKFNDRIANSINWDTNLFMAEAYDDYGPRNVIEGNKLSNRALLQFALDENEAALATITEMKNKDYAISQIRDYPQMRAFRVLTEAGKYELASALLPQTWDISFKKPEKARGASVMIHPVRNDGPWPELAVPSLVKGLIAEGKRDEARKFVESLSENNIVSKGDIDRSKEILSYYTQHDSKPPKMSWSEGRYVRKDYERSNIRDFIMRCTSASHHFPAMGPEAVALDCVKGYLSNSVNDRGVFFIPGTEGLQVIAPPP